MTKTNSTLKQMTIYDWFSYNKKLLFWTLFILITKIILPISIVLFIPMVYPENKELSSFSEEFIVLMATIEYYLTTILQGVTFFDIFDRLFFGLPFFGLPIGLNPIIASIIGFALFKTCFFEKKLITTQKIIIVLYSTVLYSIVLYFNYLALVVAIYAMVSGR